MNIDTLKCGEEVRIVGFKNGQSPYRHKLLAMGLIPGTCITLLRIAPLGDPIEIRVRGYELSLRKEEARILEVTRNIQECE